VLPYVWDVAMRAAEAMDNLREVHRNVLFH